jgi:hypothetical protein
MRFVFVNFMAGLAICGTVAVGAKIDFAHHVLPILKENCVKCHSNGKYKGGLSLETREALLESETVEVGDAAASIFIELLEAEDEDDRMPQKAAPLSAAEIAILSQWIDEGVSWEPGFTFKERKWKGPLAPRKPVLPEAIMPGENPIDRIVRAYFEENKVQPSEEIPDARFLRRVSLDLIGLLPAREELEAFAASTSPEKREKKIREILDRELDYADHWMTFWNDLLRNDYAGTGFIDGGRKQITGWLYESLKENKPYDQFVRELMNPTAESEGFIKGIKWRGEVNASQVPEIQFAQNVSQVFFGENMKCASCHDSFIDDWKLEDAYGMAAIIAGKPLEMYRCDKPTGKKMEAKFLFDELGEIDRSASRAKRLEKAAELSTSKKNGRLARTIVNRLWARLMGRGLVEPVDMMANRPWSEDMLDYLAWDLAENGYDLKRTLAMMVGSRSYQSATVAPSEKREDFVFEGPIAKRMTAEQFLDAVWGITGTEPGKIDASVARGAAKRNVDVPGEWIWSATDARPAGEEVVFTHTFKLPAGTTGRMIITCDNEYVLKINGKEIGRDSNWETVESYDVSRALQTGSNTIRVEARNLGSTPNAAALYVHLQLINPEGEAVVVTTSKEWLVNGEIAAAHQSDGWGKRVNGEIAKYLSEGGEGGSRMSRKVRASLVTSTLLMRALGRPNREQVVTTRPADLTTLQALELNNGEEFVGYLHRGAPRLSSRTKDLVGGLYLDALSRPPSDLEKAVAREILGANATNERIADFLWTVLMLPEFQFIN